MKYTIILIPDDNGTFEVQVPAFPGLHTFGRTVDEAKANAREAIELCLEDLRATGEPIPEEKQHPQALTIEVAA
ncbi:MAG: type II toxin-antitoxin system HicB family antitoxin [Chloroflexota bacterium]